MSPVVDADRQHAIPEPILQARERGDLPALPPRDQYRPQDPGVVAIELPALPVGDWSNPAAVSAALATLSVGQSQAAASLAKAVLQDPRIFGPLQIRCAGVVGLPKKFEPADGSEKAKHIADICGKHFDEWFGITEQERFLRSLLLLGSSLAQIIWLDLKPGAEYQEPSINAWDAANSVEFWYWDPDVNFGRWIISTPRGTREPTPGDGEWIFGRLTKKSPWTDALLNPLGARYVVRLNTLYKWAKYNDRIASPFFVLGNPTAQNTQAVELVKRQVQAGETILSVPIGKDGNRWTADWVAVNTATGSASFKAAMDLYAADMAIAILGQNLSTEVKGGSHAAAKVHDSVRQDLIDKDTRLLQWIYREQILKPLVVNNFNCSPDLAPYVLYETKSAENLAEWSKGLAALGQFMGSIAQMIKAGAPPEIWSSIDWRGVWSKANVPQTTAPVQPVPPVTVVDDDT